MTPKPDPATVSLASKKGAERADRLRARAQEHKRMFGQ